MVIIAKFRGILPITLLEVLRIAEITVRGKITERPPQPPLAASNVLVYVLWRMETEQSPYRIDLSYHTTFFFGRARSFFVSNSEEDCFLRRRFILSIFRGATGFFFLQVQRRRYFEWTYLTCAACCTIIQSTVEAQTQRQTDALALCTSALPSLECTRSNTCHFSFTFILISFVDTITTQSWQDNHQIIMLEAPSK